MNVEVQGAAELIRALDVNLRRALQPALVAIGAVLQGKIAPYPSAPSYSGNRWYERGFGMKYRRRDGTVTGRKTSQFLNRSWAVEPRGTDEALVTNRATYVPWVHIERTQASFHRQRGWITEVEGIRRAQASGDIVRVVDEALRRVLPS